MLIGFFPSGCTNAKVTSRGAFTLVEVLVATSVLTLMVLMMTALLDSASLSVTSSNKYLAADDQARQAFDRMQLDFARMLKRNDVYFQFLKQSGNDQLTFYSETPGYFATSVSSTSQSNLSLVDYQFNTAYQLCRLGQGYQWTDIAFTPGSGPSINPANLHVLGNSIFRMECAFLLRAGDTSLQITSVAPTPGSASFQNLEAIVVALGVLDSNSQKLVAPGAYPTLVGALHDYPDTAAGQAAAQTIALSSTSSPVASTIDPILSSWRAAITAPNFAATAGIPPAAAQQVRIYQRIIYLQ